MKHVLTHSEQPGLIRVVHLHQLFFTCVYMNCRRDLVNPNSVKSKTDNFSKITN